MTDNEEDILDEDQIEQDSRVETDAVSTTACDKCGCEIDVTGIDSFDEVECPDCSERVTVPAKLGPFLLTRMLGAGGMGAVYIAKDEALGRQVAIKIMLKELGEDPEFIAAFKREAQAAAKINHPNICQIYSFGTEKGQPYIVMELITGDQFDKLVENTKNLDQGLVMQVGLDVAQGLAAANEEEMIHGDIKPENILLDDKLKAKVVDFGIASVAGQGSEGIWGTPYYIAPEKILRQKPDGRSDMYSLGATLYHALAGRPPFEGATPVDVVKKRLEKTPAPLSSIRKDLKPEVAQVIERMLQREPSRRHPTYASLVSDLAKCVKACGGRKTSLSKLKKSGRIVLTRKSKTIGAKPMGAKQAASKPMGAKQTGSHSKVAPRIRVAKKAPKISSLSSSSARTTSPSSNGAIPKTQAAPKKPPSKAPLYIFLVLLVVGVIGGGGYYLWDKRQKELAVKREFLAYTNLMGDIGAQMTTATNLVKSVHKTLKSTSEYGPMATNAVKIVLGEDLVHPISVAAPAVPVAADEPEPESPPAAPPPAPAPTAPKVNVDSSGREAPAGIGEPAKPEPPPQPQEPAPVPAPAPAPPPPPDDEPLIKQKARKVIDQCILLAEQFGMAKECLANANAAYEEARDSRSAFVASQKLEAVKKVITNLETVKKNAHTISAQAKKASEEVDAKRIAFEKAEAERIKSADEAEKARLAAIEAQRVKEERIALIATEQGLVASAHADAINLYKLNSYRDGVNILKAQDKDLSTKEAKEIMANHIEQGTLLVEMKAYLAKRLTAAPYGWGWIQGGRGVDIVKADTKTITTRTGSHAWEEVTVRQMLHFFKKYMNDSSQSSKTLGQQNLAAAIYCHINGGASAAASYSDTALMKDPNIGPLVSRVLPQEEPEF